MAELPKSPLKSVKILGDVLNPTNNCAICLDKSNNEGFVDPCLHKYCYSCIIKWSKHSPVCPLCMRKFNAVIHNVRKLNDYDTTFIKPLRPKNITLFRDVQNRGYYTFRPELEDSDDSDEDVGVNTSNMTAITPILNIFEENSTMFRFFRSAPSTSGMSNPGGSSGTFSRVNIMRPEVSETDVSSNNNNVAVSVSSIGNTPVNVEMYNVVTEADASVQTNDETQVMNTAAVVENDVMTVYAPTDDSTLSIIVNYDPTVDISALTSRNVMVTSNTDTSLSNRVPPISVSHSSYSTYDGTISRIVTSFLQRNASAFAVTSGGSNDGVLSMNTSILSTHPGRGAGNTSVSADNTGPALFSAARSLYRRNNLPLNADTNIVHTAPSNTAGTTSNGVINTGQSNSINSNSQAPRASTSSGNIVNDEVNPQSRYNLRKRASRVSAYKAPPSKRNRRYK